MKTPEEIKKGLKACSTLGHCTAERCPYYKDGIGAVCIPTMSDDSLAYIQQLESRLAQVERERDAAVNDIPRACGYCRHYLGGEYIPHCNAECMNISGINTGWQWRGVCEENTKEDVQDENK